MALADELLNLDYLIYSSHKTGTQTLTRTLNSNGFKCRHCHYLPNIDLNNGEFRRYLESYLKKNRKKLNVITMFREPMERHVSSFFQGYGSRPLRLKEVENKHETIIYKYTIKQLQEKYISELRDHSLIGFHESIHDICRELSVRTDNLEYSNTKRFGLFETELIRLFLFRFDILFDNFNHLLTRVTDKNIIITNSNISNQKWYRKIYTEFKASLVIPDDVISEVYNQKQDLINLFYSNNYDSRLKQALVNYGGSRESG